MSPKATKINQCPAGLKSAVLGRIRENFTFLTLDGVSFFFERGAYFLGLFFDILQIFLLFLSLDNIFH